MRRFLFSIRAPLLAATGLLAALAILPALHDARHRGLASREAELALRLDGAASRLSAALAELLSERVSSEAAMRAAADDASLRQAMQARRRDASG